LQLESLRGGNSGALNAAYARVVQLQRELEQVQAGPTQGQVGQADIAIRQAQAQVDQAAAALSKKSLVAPLDGLVTAVNVELGSLGTPALPAVEITDLSPLRVTVQVDEVDIRQIREGMTARIEVDALPGVAMAGVIERIALVGTNNNGIISYDVQIRLDSVDPRVRPGMTAEATVVVEERADVLVVPNEYIRLDRQQGTAFVNIVTAEGGLQEVEVTLGLQGRDTSEIVSGVSAGDTLAVDLGGDRLSFIGG
jgi:HlyD family secretion protein